MNSKQKQHCKCCRRLEDGYRCALYVGPLEEAIAICKRASWKEVDCQRSIDWHESLPTGLIAELLEARDQGVSVEW